MTLHWVVDIGGTDYGPSGTNKVQTVHVEPSTYGKLGTATVTLLGTGDNFRRGHEIKVYQFDGVATYGLRLFGGFVARVGIEHLSSPATNANRLTTLECVDYNELLDTTGVDISSSTYLTDGGVTTFDGQVERMVRFCTTGAYVSTTIDTSGVAITGGTMPAFPGTGFQGYRLRNLLQYACNEWQRLNPTTRPVFDISLRNGTGTPGPILNIYDSASTAPSPVYTFDVDSTSNKTVLTSTVRRTKDYADQETKVQAFTGNFPAGRFATATSSLTATYPNPYDDRTADGVWQGETFQAESGLSTLQVQAVADRVLAARENPLETVEFSSQDSSLTTMVYPGDRVAVTWATEGLAATAYYVASLTVDLEPGRSNPLWHFTLGNRIPELGDNPTGEAAGRVVEFDVIRPAAPTSFTGTATWNGRDFLVVRLSWTASTSPDVERYAIRCFVSSQSYTIYVERDSSGNLDTTALTHVRVGQTGTFYCYAIDDEGNISDASNTWTLTSADTTPPPVDKLINPDFLFEDLEDSTQAAGWTFTPTNSGVGTRELASAVGASVQGKYVYQISCPGGGFNGGTITSHKISIADTTAAGVSSSYARYVRAILQSNAALGAYNVTCDVYDNLDNLIGSVTVASGTPNASYQYADGNFVQAGAAYFTIAIDVINNGVSALTVWVSGVMTGDAVITNMIKNLNVTSGKIAALAVTSSKIAAGAVTAGKIATGGVSASAQFAAGVVDSTALGAGAVTAGKIAAGGISAASQFAAGVVDSTALGASAVTNAKLSTITDPTKFLFDVQSNPLIINDNAAAEKGRISYTGANLMYRAASGTPLELVADGANIAQILLDPSNYNRYGSATTSTPHIFTNGSLVSHHAALATTATDGFFYVTTCAGAPSGTPTAQTGTCAMVYDTTNNNLYVYNGAWKKVGLV